MKTKFIIFRVALIVFILIYILAVLFYLLITFTGGKNIPEVLLRTTWISETIHTNFYVYFCIDILKDVLIIYTLTQILKIADRFMNASYFTPKIIQLLQFSGYVFIGAAIIGIFNSLFYNYLFSEHIMERMLLPIMFYFMVLIIGLGLLAAEETYNKGLLLKRENELTI